MNRFFALLSDEAARPDPVFIAELQAKVNVLARGGLPPSGSGPLPALLIAAAVSLAAIGGVVYAAVSHDPQPVPTLEQPQSVVVPRDNTVLAVRDAQPLPDDNATQAVVTDQAPATTQEVSGSPDILGADTLVATTPTAADTSGSAALDQNYQIDFWTVPLFKLAPTIPTTPADLTMSGVAQLNFNWGESSPGSGVTKNHFVARATASKYLAAGAHTMTISADDGVRVYIDGVLAYDRWHAAAAGTQDKVAFNVRSADAPTQIIIEYYEFQESAQLVVDIT